MLRCLASSNRVLEFVVVHGSFFVPETFALQLMFVDQPWFYDPRFFRNRNVYPMVVGTSPHASDHRHD